jgi:hypothetical protein
MAYVEHVIEEDSRQHVKSYGRYRDPETGEEIDYIRCSEPNCIVNKYLPERLRKHA